jgi:hypothetical protein
MLVRDSRKSTGRIDWPAQSGEWTTRIGCVAVVRTREMDSPMKRTILAASAAALALASVGAQAADYMVPVSGVIWTSAGFCQPDPVDPRTACLESSPFSGFVDLVVPTAYDGFHYQAGIGVNLLNLDGSPVSFYAPVSAVSDHDYGVNFHVAGGRAYDINFQFGPDVTLTLEMEGGSFFASSGNQHGYYEIDASITPVPELPTSGAMIAGALLLLGMGLRSRA